MYFLIKLCAEKLELKDLSIEFDTIQSSFKDFEKGIGSFLDSNMATQFERGLTEHCKRCWALFRDMTSKITDELEQALLRRNCLQSSSACKMEMRYKRLEV